MHKLTIRKYGRFSERVFELSPVTVFFGGNESGKTTIFDALSEQLCRTAAKNTALWRRLSARYGEPSARIAEADVNIPYDSYEEFLSLFSVRSSDMSIDAGKDAWTAAAGRNLFFQGLDISKMSENLMKTAEPHPLSRDSKNFNALEAELQEAEAELAVKLEQERRAAGQKRNLDVLDRELGSLDSKASQLRQLHEQQKEKIEELKKERRLARAVEYREIVSSYVAKSRFCEENPFVSYDGLKEYDRLVAARDEAKAKYDAARAVIKMKEQHLKDVEKALPLQEQARKSAEMLEGAAKNFRPEIEKIFEIRRENDKFNESPLVISFVAPLICLVFCAAAFAFHTKTLVAWLLVPAGLVLGWLFHSNFVRRRDRAAEKARENVIVANVLKTWGERFDVTPIRGLEPEQMVAKFDELIKTAEAERAKHIEMLQDKEKSQMDITDANTQSIGVQISYDTSSESTKSWLADRGCTDRDSYLRLAEQKKEAEKFINENREKIETMKNEESCMSSEALLALLDSRVKKGDGQTSAADENALENKISQLEAEAEKTAAQIRTVEEESRKTAVDKARNDTDFENACSGIPAAIAGLRTKIMGLKEKIAAEQTRRQAAGLAASVMTEMNTDAAAKFRELARKAASFIAGIVPAAEIEITSLSSGGLKLKDAYGVFRTPEMLSAGARDCLMLGMRLCLAAESFGNRDKVMLLDDPFLNLDQNRMQRAMEVLRRFHTVTGCQLVFFTKEVSMLGLLERDWRVKVHKLP